MTTIADQSTITNESHTWAVIAVAALAWIAWRALAATRLERGRRPRVPAAPLPFDPCDVRGCTARATRTMYALNADGSTVARRVCGADALQGAAKAWWIA